VLSRSRVTLEEWIASGHLALAMTNTGLNPLRLRTQDDARVTPLQSSRGILGEI
jgi:hypothetical protein